MTMHKNILSSIIGGLIVSAICYSLPFVYNNFITELEHNKLTWFIIALIIGFLFYVLWSKFLRNLVILPSINQDFEILKKHVTYEYLDDSLKSMHYTRVLLLKCVRNGVSKYFDKYQWSGKGTIRVKSLIDHHTYTETVKRDLWQCFMVDLHKTIKIGETVKVELDFDLIDEAGSSIPFLSSITDVPTKELILTVKLPKNLGVREGSCETSYLLKDEVPYKKEIKPFVEGVLEWKPEDLKLARHYAIRWKF